MARRCIKGSIYRRGARLAEAPTVVDCSSFVKWLYGQRGIWLPRRSIQQSQIGSEVNLNDITAGDLVFISGRIDYYHTDPTQGIGHVGVATHNQTMIHAANKKINLEESPLDRFITKENFRCIRRYVPKDAKVLTLETPAEREIETSDDIKWVVLQSLPEI